MNIQQKNRPASIGDRDERLKKIASYNRNVLEAMTVSELRELSAFIISNARKFKKPELIDAMMTASESFRQQLSIDAIKAVEFMGEIDFGKLFVKGCFSKGLTAKETGEAIWKKIDSMKYADSTVCKTQLKKLRNILAIVFTENPDSKDWCDEVYKIVKGLAVPFSERVNKDSREKVEHYGEIETLRTLDGAKILKWATEIIDWTYDQENLVRGWQKVSLALALTSGRRMDEIHGFTQYEALDDKTLKNKGLSKKRDDDFILESPCLVDAYKWVLVRNKLPESRLNLPNSIVNGVISSSMSATLKPTVYPLLDIEQYKDSRDFYIAYLIATVYDRRIHGSELNYAKALVGHESKKVTLSYQKLVVV